MVVRSSTHAFGLIITAAMGCKPSADVSKCSIAAAMSAMEARLTIVHITDVYILDNFPHLRTLIQRKKQENPNTISMLTGDFLAPYLLSSIDKGAAMMSMIVRTPIDILTWGNHEADIPHPEVCKRVKEFHGAGGVWVNSNMQEHEMMHLQKPYEVVKVRSRDGSHTRQVGLVAVLSDDPSLYKKFKSPGAFNGAKIECPWATLERYKKVLEEEERCDLVLPLQHLYEIQDQKTCEQFDFPVVLSGHDHHLVDKEINGTRLLKPGSDGHFATVLDLSWGTASSSTPSIKWEAVKVSDFPPDKSMVSAMEASYLPLARIRNTELTPVPARFRPLSSVGSRGRVTTMGTFICSLAREAVNASPSRQGCDFCMIRGGHINGEKDYPADSIFSLEDLKTVNTDEVSLGVVEVPGEVVVRGVRSTRGSVSRLFMQYDDGVTEEDGTIVRIAGAPVEPERLYRIATTPTSIRDVPTFAEYFQDRGLPGEEEFVPLDAELLGYCARAAWQRIVDLCRPGRAGEVSNVEAIDLNKDGVISKEEIQSAMRRLGMRVADGEFTLVDFIVAVGDLNEDGLVDEYEVRLSGKLFPQPLTLEPPPLVLDDVVE